MAKKGWGRWLWILFLYGLAIDLVVVGFQRFREGPFLAVAMVWAGLVLAPITTELLKKLPMQVTTRSRWLIGAVPLATAMVAALIFQPKAAPAIANKPVEVAANKPVSTLSAEEENRIFAQGYAERVEFSMLPELEKLETDQPSSIAQMWQRLGVVELMRRELIKGEKLTLNASQKATSARFKKALASKQARAYPAFRAAYRAGMKEALWIQDIDVTGSGRSMTFTGVIFARRANSAEAYKALEPDLRRLRFSNVDYRWIKNGDGTRFTTDAPADVDVTSE